VRVRFPCLTILDIDENQSPHSPLNVIVNESLDIT